MIKKKYILSCTTIEDFYSVKDAIKRMKRQVKEGEKYVFSLYLIKTCIQTIQKVVFSYFFKN